MYVHSRNMKKIYILEVVVLLKLAPNSKFRAERRGGKKAASVLRAPAAPSTAFQMLLLLLLPLHPAESRRWPGIMSTPSLTPIFRRERRIRGRFALVVVGIQQSSLLSAWSLKLSLDAGVLRWFQRQQAWRRSSAVPCCSEPKQNPTRTIRMILCTAVHINGCAGGPALLWYHTFKHVKGACLVVGVYFRSCCLCISSTCPLAV